MNVMLQHHGAKRIYPLPEGIRELCTDISREVLRCQPTNIYGFIADYLDALLYTRETAIVAARILGDILDQSVSYEAAWKRRGIGLEEVNRAAIVLQAAYRGFVTRKALHLSSLPPGIDDILTKCGINLYTGIRACTIIQAAFRGHLARKMFEAHKATCRIILQCGTDAVTVNKACVIIQTAYRGHLARKYLQTHKVPVGAITDEEERKCINKMLIVMNVTWEQANSAATRIQRMFKTARAKLQERPPGEPQQVSRRTPFQRMPETKDAVEASAGPLGLTRGEVAQLAEEIIGSMVSKASGYEMKESEEIAETIIETLVTKASETAPEEYEREQAQDVSGDYTEIEEIRGDEVSATKIEEADKTEAEDAAQDDMTHADEPTEALKPTQNVSGDYVEDDKSSATKTEAAEDSTEHEADQEPTESDTTEQSADSPRQDNTNEEPTTDSEQTTTTEAPPSTEPASSTEGEESTEN